MKRSRRTRLFSRFLLPAALMLNGYAIAQKTPEELLDQRGLRREGKFYVTANEDGTRKRLRTILPVHNKMFASIADCEAAIEAELWWRALDNERIAEETFIADRRLKINQAPPTPEGKAWCGIWRGEINNTTDNLNVLRGQLAIAAKDRVSQRVYERRVEVFNACKDEFQAASKELEPFVKEAGAEYDKLSEDLDIRNALLVLEGRTGAPFDLGPSNAFKAEVTGLRMANQKVSWSPESYRTSARKKKRAIRKPEPANNSKSAMQESAGPGKRGETEGSR